MDMAPASGVATRGEGESHPAMGADFLPWMGGWGSRQRVGSSAWEHRMSFASVDWALKQPVSKSSAKFILVCMCNYSGPNGECFSSIPLLARDSGQDERTVRANLKLLVRENWIVDSGHRVGRTKQIPVYLLAPQAAMFWNPPKNGSLSKPNPPKNVPRTLPKMYLEPSQKWEGDSVIDSVTEKKQVERSVQQSEEQRTIGLHHISEIMGILGQ